MFDWSFYKPSTSKYPSWVPDRTIFLTKAGSHSYGTATESSDLDIRGICIAPVEDYHGFLKSESPKKFEQIVINEPNDVVVYELRKCLLLAAASNPNALEIIFTDSSDHLFSNDLGNILLENRNLFLSKRCKWTHAGYAAAQMHKLQLHYAWNHDDTVSELPSRESFGLKLKPEISKNQLDAALSMITKRLDEWNLIGLQNVDSHTRILLTSKMTDMLVEAKVSTDKLWEGCARTLGMSENFIDLVAKEKLYKAAVENFYNYKEWLQNRNPARAALEKKVGYDAKHGAHLVRLYRQCSELLTTGKLNVKRHDAKELLEIRSGSWSYEKIIAYAEEQKILLEDLYKNSSLPNDPDYDKIDKLCQYIVEKSFKL